MSLETTLSDITARLRQGKYPNEQAISQGIVLRVFQELGWDTWDTNVVWPEYQTGEGRADFALCHPPSKPAVFTEVKQPGKAEEAVRQALEYAFHTGVPFVVLTDGRTWSFYLPAEQGSYEDRRVYKLDLYERPPAEAGEILQRYLERAKVESGEALEIARKEYRSRNRRSQAKAAIPEAWHELVEKGDELLVEMLTSAVESKTGVRPDADDVAEFLAGLGRPIIVEAQRGSATQPTSAVSPHVRFRCARPRSRLEVANWLSLARLTLTTTPRTRWSSSFENSLKLNPPFSNAAPNIPTPKGASGVTSLGPRRNSIQTVRTSATCASYCRAVGWSPRTSTTCSKKPSSVSRPKSPDCRSARMWLWTCKLFRAFEVLNRAPSLP